jgi:hypothetical protein
VRVDGQRVEGPDADWIHLPDPIAEAIQALSARIVTLERTIAELSEGQPQPVAEVRPCAPSRVLTRRAARPSRSGARVVSVRRGSRGDVAAAAGVSAPLRAPASRSAAAEGASMLA